jgi:hypothetical protein
MRKNHTAWEALHLANPESHLPAQKSAKCSSGSFVAFSARDRAYI